MRSIEVSGGNTGKGFFKEDVSMVTEKQLS